MIRLFFIGDIFGEPGRKALKKVADIRQRERVDFVIANVENAAKGKGVTPRLLEEIRKTGIDAFTSGNHIWDQRDIIPYISQARDLVRPANYPEDSPGPGSIVCPIHSGINIGIINVEGQRFMPQSNDCPYHSVDREIKKLNGKCDFIFVDFHAETTSEKRMMGWHLDGRVVALVGTHTHVQTADEEILPLGTAYISDAGMTGPYHSVIGMDVEVAKTRLIRHMPESLQVGEGNVKLCGVLIDVDESKGKALKIQRVQEPLEE